MNRILLRLGFMLSTFCMATSAAAVDRIVAVVNDQVITLSELQERTQLSARALQVQNITAQQAAALQRRTLLEMVDEQLQQQYATSNGMAFTRAELQQAKDAAISTMGQENWQNLTQGLSRAAEAKVLAEATWARLEASAIRPRVQVAGPEVDRMIAEMSKSQNRTERNLSLIFIPRETASVAATEAVSGTTPTDVEALTTEIRAQATAPEATAATFAELARTYSAAPSAKDGGALGWLLTGEVPAAIAGVVADIPEGGVSAPIPTTEGVMLVRVNGIRSQTQTVDFEPREERLLALFAAARPSETAAIEPIKAGLEGLKKRTSTWLEVQSLLKDPETMAQFPRSSLLGWVPISALQPAVREAVNKTKAGAWSPVIDDRGQLSRLYVAEERRTMPPEVLALRERVQQSLMANRVELEGRRFMRELRQRAFVDLRL